MASFGRGQSNPISRRNQDFGTSRSGWPRSGSSIIRPQKKVEPGGNTLALALPRVLFVADSNRSSGVLRSFFKVVARPADGNERIQDLDVQGGWYGELA